MELLLLMVGAGFLAYLWNRVSLLERRIGTLEEGGATGGVAMDPQHSVPSTDPDRAKAAEPLPSAMLAAADLSVMGPPKLAPEPVPEPEPAPIEAISAPMERPVSAAAQPTPSPSPVERGFKLDLDFEYVFGRLLPIWAGGIALAVAGFFLVRFSIESGLLTPTVRVFLSFAFGAGLIAAAEAAFRMEHRIADERVRQALAGAGLATLYASFYLAGSHYGMIGAGLSFVGLAAVTAGAIALSFRFGLPCAILGLVGGFAAPTLVSSADPNVPLLALYLALVTAGLSFTGSKQNRVWLSLAALGGGLGWGWVLLLTGISSGADVVAAGLYLIAIGALLPALAQLGKMSGAGRFAAAAMATLQMAALVWQDGYSVLALAQFALLGAALAFFGWTDRRLREGGAIAAAIGLFLLASWSDPAAGTFAIMAAAFTLVFAGIPLAHIWRRAAHAVDFGVIAAFPLAMSAAISWQFADGPYSPGPALASLALALLPIAACYRHWPKHGVRVSHGVLAALAGAGATIFLALTLIVAHWAWPFITAGLAVAVFVLAKGRAQAALANLGWVVGAAGLIVLPIAAAFFAEAELLGGTPHDTLVWQAALRWAAVALPFALLALLEHRKPQRAVAEVFAAALAYGVLAQVLPAYLLPSAAAAAAIGTGVLARERLAGQVTFLAITLMWALDPLMRWFGASMESLVGEPVLVSSLPRLIVAAKSILPLMIAMALSLRLSLKIAKQVRLGLWALTGAIGVAALHIVYKQLFAIGSIEAFAVRGLAERTVWEAMLLGVAAIAWSLRDRFPAAKIAMMAAAAVALAHFTAFTLLLHNPLWSAQYVGPLPLANLLLPAYGIGIAALVFLRQNLGAVNLERHSAKLRPAFDAAIMVVVSLLALSLLRHGFAGSLLTTSDVGQTEDLLRSLLGIVLAAGFIGWGAYSGERTWRIGSLVLMLLAVLKVFLFDAAGLEGLARIASFMALGFSLIGIGWFYTRQLKKGGAGELEAASA